MHRDGQHSRATPRSLGAVGGGRQKKSKTPNHYSILFRVALTCFFLQLRLSLSLV